jgi:hypothetical protein
MIIGDLYSIIPSKEGHKNKAGRILATLIAIGIFVVLGQGTIAHTTNLCISMGVFSLGVLILIGVMAIPMRRT